MAAAGFVCARTARVRARAVRVEHRDGAPERPGTARSPGLSTGGGRGRAGVVAERQVARLPAGESAGDHPGRRPGVAAIAAAHQRRSRSHLVARRAASGVQREQPLLQLALLGAPRRDGPPPRHSPGGSLARLVDHGKDRFCQLRRPEQRTRRPQGRHLHDQTRRLAATAPVRPLLGHRRTARLVARWEQDRVRCAPAHLHHGGGWPPAPAADRALRRQRPRVVAGRQVHRLHPRARRLCHASQRARASTGCRRSRPGPRRPTPLGRVERTNLAAAPR